MSTFAERHGIERDELRRLVDRRTRERREQRDRLDAETFRRLGDEPDQPEPARPRLRLVPPQPKEEPMPEQAIATTLDREAAVQLLAVETTYPDLRQALVNHFEIEQAEIDKVRFAAEQQ